MKLYKDQLQTKAIELQNELKRQNIDIFFNTNSFKDYLLKLTVSVKCVPRGNLFLYYKPTKNTYSLKVHLKTSGINSLINSVWNKLNNVEVYPAQTNIYEAFVDGSYISEITGYGAVIYLGDDIKAEISGIVPNSSFRQFGGELKSVIEVLKWGEINNVKKMRINYDYVGIEKFVTHEWKARNVLSIEYVNFVNSIKTEIQWRHIKSHTGDVRNEKADLLAKKAATGYLNF
ncbi:MAG: hypothetical protein LBL77_02770 [Endomicrobium sp.]|jgi:ribonuclease HI|nr:hypothetical protein [Endomicrobium sp.]